jgi:hypothetical protein
MARPRHPNGDIEKAVQYAEKRGWLVKISKGHAWGRIWCPHHTREGCQTSIWSTPKSPYWHAKRVIAYVDRCPHQKDNDGKE